MIREFTENDWDAFAGADIFPCGGSPIIDDEDEHLVLVASGSQVEAIPTTGDNLMTIYAIKVAFPTQEAAKIFLRGLPGTMSELIDVGFERLN